MGTFVKLIRNSFFYMLMKYSIYSNDFAVFCNLIWQPSLYKILRYWLLMGFWNIHSFVYCDIWYDGHSSGSIHTLEANIILGFETQIYWLWTRNIYLFWNTNIVALNYKYICSEMQIYLPQTTNIFAKIANAAKCTQTVSDTQTLRWNDYTRCHRYNLWKHYQLEWKWFDLLWPPQKVN